MIEKNRPNLFIVGAMKSGTTSLHEYLNEHPEIFMSSFKEPSFFVENEQLLKHWPRIKYKPFWKSEEEYLKLFEDAGNAKIIGESSTTYAKLDELTGVAERLHQFNPSAKIIYVMRDPIKRTISHYWHMVQDHDEMKSPLEAIKADNRYLDVSYYAKQLKPYYSLYREDQIMCFTFEEMLQEPERILKNIFKWLGVDENFVPVSSGEQFHASPEQIVKTKGFGYLRRFKRTNFWRKVHGYFPGSLKKLARNMAEVEVEKTSDDALQEVIEYLRPIQAGQTKELTALLKREFHEWKTLFSDKS